MEAIIWEKSLSVGIPELDKQHKEIIKLINDLYRVVVEGEEEIDVKALILSLNKYTLQHFTLEELLFKKHDYPGYVNHKLAHDTFKKEISRFQERLLKNADLETVLRDLLFYLQRWFLQHVKKLDLEYASFFREKGVVQEKE